MNGISISLIANTITLLSYTGAVLVLRGTGEPCVHATLVSSISSLVTSLDFELKSSSTTAAGFALDSGCCLLDFLHSGASLFKLFSTVLPDWLAMLREDRASLRLPTSLALPLRTSVQVFRAF